MPDPLETWFKREVLPHEEMLMRYLARVWPRRDELADIRQEAYARVYEAARESIPQLSKAFLFSIARHIMIDRRRRERIVSIQAAGGTDFSSTLIEENNPERCVGAWQELARVARAFDLLPSRCREIVWMRRVQDISQKEVARQLGISAKTVENQVSKGSRLLAQYMHPGEELPKAARIDSQCADDAAPSEAKVEE